MIEEHHRKRVSMYSADCGARRTVHTDFSKRIPKEVWNGAPWSIMPRSLLAVGRKDGVWIRGRVRFRWEKRDQLEEVGVEASPINLRYDEGSSVAGGGWREGWGSSSASSFVNVSNGMEPVRDPSPSSPLAVPSYCAPHDGISCFLLLHSISAGPFVSLQHPERFSSRFYACVRVPIWCLCANPRRRRGRGGSPGVRGRGWLSVGRGLWCRCTGRARPLGYSAAVNADR